MADLINQCQLHQLRSVQDPNGLLVVNAELAVPFLVRRVFTVIAPGDSLRGQHAHRICSQFLMVTSGEVAVSVTDGSHSKDYLLNSPALGLFVPPMLWASEYFVVEASSLLVLCDQEYDESDYIRDWDDFLELVSIKAAERH